jgi:hypothetical protein
VHWGIQCKIPVYFHEEGLKTTRGYVGKNISDNRFIMNLKERDILSMFWREGHGKIRNIHC